MYHLLTWADFSALPALVLYMLHWLMLEELTLLAITAMLVSSWFSWHMRTCHSRCTAGLTTRLLGTPSEWMSVQHQGANFTPRLSYHESERPLGIEGLTAVSSGCFCFNNNVKQQSGFWGRFCQPSLSFRGWLLPTGLLWPLSTWKYMILTPVNFICFRASLQTKLESYVLSCSGALLSLWALLIIFKL